MTIEGEENLSWYFSRPEVRRGFCSNCGASLFWDPVEKDWMGVAMGAFDAPTGTKLHVHVWVSELGDYYEIADGVPQSE